MKKSKYLLALLTGLMLATTGCNSTPDSSSSSSNEAIAEPTVSLTVVAQKLQAWPYSKAKLTYKLSYMDILQTNFTDDMNKWKDDIQTSIEKEISALGLTKKTPANIEIIYGLTPASAKSDSSDTMFNSLGLTTGSTKFGSNTTINVSIKDVRSGKIIWSGAVSATADKPITDKYRAKVIDSLISSLLQKLPVAL